MERDSRKALRKAGAYLRGRHEDPEAERDDEPIKGATEVEEEPEEQPAPEEAPADDEEERAEAFLEAEEPEDAEGEEEEEGEAAPEPEAPKRWYGINEPPWRGINRGYRAAGRWTAEQQAEYEKVKRWQVERERDAQRRAEREKAEEERDWRTARLLWPEVFRPRQSTEERWRDERARQWEWQQLLDEANCREEIDARMRALTGDPPRITGLLGQGTPEEWKRRRAKYNLPADLYRKQRRFLQSALERPGELLIDDPIGLEREQGLKGYARAKLYWQAFDERKPPLRFGYPPQVGLAKLKQGLLRNVKVYEPYYGYEPQPAGRPKKANAMTAAERQRKRRQRLREKAKRRSYEISAHGAMQQFCGYTTAAGSRSTPPR
jgi:hypothetical protein